MSEVGSRPCSSIILTYFLGTNLGSLVSGIVVTCDNSGLKTSFVNGYVNNNNSTITVLFYDNPPPQSKTHIIKH